MKLQDFNILYINLDHRKDRLKWIQNELNRLNLLHRQNKITKRISGINGQELHNSSYVQKLAKEFGVPVEKMKTEYWYSRRNFKTMSKNKKSILGRVGCYLAHLRAIKYAQQHKLLPVVILEDDCVFLAKDNSTIRFPKPPSNSDMFYLGGLFWHNKNSSRDSISKKIRWLKINTDKLKLPCAFAYGFNKEQQVNNVLNLLTSVWLEGTGKEKPKDWKSKKERIRATYLDLMFVNFVQRYGNAYVLHPVVALQSSKFLSDVTDFGKVTPENPFNHKYFYSEKEEKEVMDSLK